MVLHFIMNSYVEGNEEIQICIIHQVAYFHKCNIILMLLTSLSYLACGVGPRWCYCGQYDLTFLRLKFHQSERFHSTHWKNPKSKSSSASHGGHCQICSGGKY